MSRDYLDELAEFAVNTRLEDLDPATVSAAKNVALDTIGAMLAGSRQPENANLAQLAADKGRGGKSTLLGSRAKSQAMLAALANATAGVSLEVDEGTRLGGGHPAIHVTPAALAVGEELSNSGRASSGRKVLESIIVGYEITSRIGGATTARHEIHSHGTWGTIGSAVAAAKLMGFDAAQMRQTINLAASMSPANTWTPCFEGATVRNLYPGRSNLQGILAANLSQCGFTAIQDGPADLYASVLGAGFDPQNAIEGLGQSGSYRIQQNYFKFHACCWYNHPVLDAVQSLQRQNEFDAVQVKQVRVSAPAMAMTMTNPEPDNMLSAKFSIPYAVAHAIVAGTTDVFAFQPDRVADPSVQEFARRVVIEPDPQMDLRRYDYPAAKVTLVLADGRSLHEDVVAHRGDFRNPAPQEELEAKFLSLSRDVLGQDGAMAVIEAVGRMDAIENVNTLTELCQGG